MRKRKVLENQVTLSAQHSFIQKAVEDREDRSRNEYGQKVFSPISPKVLKANGDKSYRAIN